MVFNRVILLIVLVACVCGPVKAQPQPPARDNSAQQNRTPVQTGVISGHVVAADSGRPLKRARVLVTAAEHPVSRATQTDDTGLYELNELPAGRYTLVVSKTGFIALSYGQRRPLQAGTPLQLLDGQQLKNVDFRLPRGGAIGGHVVDEDGEPAAGATVRVLAYQNLQGDRRLLQVDMVQSDDRGAYRVWGLSPADYYLSAAQRGIGGGGPGGVGSIGGMVQAGRGGALTMPLDSPNEQEPVVYAPRYFPGVGSLNEAKPVTLGIGQEVLDIDFGIEPVRTSRLGGHVFNSDSTPVTAGMITLTSDGAGGGVGRGQAGTNYGSRIQREGAFSIANVPPGRYTLLARSANGDASQYAKQPLTINDGDVSEIMIVLALGGTITGAVTFQSTKQPLPADVTQMRVIAPSTDANGFGASPSARVDNAGHFVLKGVSAGMHVIRADGAGRGWTLKSVIVQGHDVIDEALELRSGQTLANVGLIFTDRLSQIAGTVISEQRIAIVDCTVLAFPTNQALWRPQSRQIKTARPDQNGKYQMSGLPPGDYYMAIIDPTEQGEWFEPSFLEKHQRGAIKVALGEGDIKTQDFRVATP